MTKRENVMELIDLLGIPEARNKIIDTLFTSIGDLLGVTIDDDTVRTFLVERGKQRLGEIAERTVDIYHEALSDEDLDAVLAILRSPGYARLRHLFAETQDDLETVGRVWGESLAAEMRDYVQARVDSVEKTMKEARLRQLRFPRSNPCCGYTFRRFGEDGREYCSSCGAELPA